MVMLGGTKTLLIDIRDREPLFAANGAARDHAANEVGEATNSGGETQQQVTAAGCSSRSQQQSSETIGGDLEMGTDASPRQEENNLIKDKPVQAREEIVKLGLKRRDCDDSISLSHILYPLVAYTLFLFLSPLSLLSPFLLCQSSINSATTCERKKCQRHSTR